jgi:hypothetical protein
MSSTCCGCAASTVSICLSSGVAIREGGPSVLGSGSGNGMKLMNEHPAWALGSVKSKVDELGVGCSAVDDLTDVSGT